MRPTLLLAAALISAAASGTALAQTPGGLLSHHAAPEAAPVPAPPPAAPASDDLTASTQPAISQAQLDALTDKIAADEVVMTRLRNAELAQENARIRAIKPAMPHSGSPLFVLGFLADL